MCLHKSTSFSTVYGSQLPLFPAAQYNEYCSCHYSTHASHPTRIDLELTCHSHPLCATGVAAVEEVQYYSTERSYLVWTYSRRRTTIEVSVTLFLPKRREAVIRLIPIRPTSISNVNPIWKLLPNLFDSFHFSWSPTFIKFLDCATYLCHTRRHSLSLLLFYASYECRLSNTIPKFHLLTVLAQCIQYSSTIQSI